MSVFDTRRLVGGSKFSEWRPGGDRGRPQPGLLEVPRQRRVTFDEARQGEGMDKAAANKITEALGKHAGASRGRLEKATGMKAGPLKWALSALVKAGTILSSGERAGTRYWLPGQDQNAPGAVEKPPAKRTSKKAPAKKAKARRSAALKAPRAQVSRSEPRKRTGNALFAIDHEGTLGLTKGDKIIKLDAVEFRELRAFIDSSAAIWSE